MIAIDNPAGSIPPDSPSKDDCEPTLPEFKPSSNFTSEVESAETLSTSLKSEMKSVDEGVLASPDQPDHVYEPVTIYSMTKVIEALKSEALQVVDGEYHLRGPITADEARNFRAYTHRVTEVLLDDVKRATSTKTIAAGTWLRLLQLQTLHFQSPTIFFPSLSRLKIDGCSGVWDLGTLFLTPSLKNIAVSRIPGGQSGAFLTFLHNLAESAPHLLEITCDETCSFNSFAGVLTLFTHLRTVNIGVSSETTITKHILRDIGRLPVLECLILDATRSIYSDADVSQDSGAVATPVDDSPVDPDDVYLQLHTLKVQAQLKLLEDLVAMVSSRTIKAISLTSVAAVQPAVARNKPQPRMGTSQQSYTPAPENLHDLVETIHLKWRRSLRSIHLSSQGIASCISLKDLQRMTCFPSLRELDVSGRTLQVNYADGFAPFPKRTSNVTTIHLPINAAPNEGFDFSQLRKIVDSFPSLVSLRCGFKPLSEVPALPNRTFGLKTLITGSSSASNSTSWSLKVAQYLDAMFPDLRTMKAQKNCDPQAVDEWDHIFDLIRMCQRSRTHHAAVNKSGE